MKTLHQKLLKMIKYFKIRGHLALSTYFKILSLRDQTGKLRLNSNNKSNRTKHQSSH